MNLARRQSPLRLCLFAWLACAPLAAAQVGDLDMRLPMDIDADNTTLDGKNSMIIFNGLRLTQGHVSIQADEGRAARMELEDSYWSFTGNVIIDVAGGRIVCDSAELWFDDFRLKEAVVTGGPATYDLKRAGSEETTHAEARNLRYDVDKGVIEFSGNAIIVEGGNQISSNVLVYNIAEQRINADSAGEEDGRVRITYTPANGVNLPQAVPEDGETRGEDDSPVDADAEDDNP